MEAELCEHGVAMLPWQASELSSHWEYCSSRAGSHYPGLTDLPEAVTVLCEGCQVSFSWCCCTCRNVAAELERRPGGEGINAPGAPPPCPQDASQNALPLAFPSSSVTPFLSRLVLHSLQHPARMSRTYTGIYLHIS